MLAAAWQMQCDEALCSCVALATAAAAAACNGFLAVAAVLAAQAAMAVVSAFEGLRTCGLAFMAICFPGRIGLTPPVACPRVLRKGTSHHQYHHESDRDQAAPEPGSEEAHSKPPNQDTTKQRRISLQNVRRVEELRGTDTIQKGTATKPFPSTKVRGQWKTKNAAQAQLDYSNQAAQGA